MSATWRTTQKADRRARLLREASRLFAERGFAAVSTVDLGDAVGVSGPALYKHFASKDALLAELLVDASERLLDGCRGILADGSDPRATLRALLDFHADFATSDPDIIRLQDRELASLPDDTSHRVRALQRAYVQEWDGVLAAVRPDLSASARQTRLLGVFGLLNSTPHSAGASGEEAAAVLAGMAERALVGDD
jgi:AcrR family transcriptional regulator